MSKYTELFPEGSAKREAAEQLEESMLLTRLIDHDTLAAMFVSQAVMFKMYSPAGYEQYEKMVLDSVGAKRK